MSLENVIVKTKLHTPTLRSEHVPRLALLKLLKENSKRKLTLLDAPAGYGKTTLLTEWYHSEESNLSFAWVSLDEQDNDVVRLWRHVIEALSQLAPMEGFGADALVGLSVVGTNPIETTLPMLINELAELPSPVVVVLDDYHCIEHSACHESMAFFIEHVPDMVHVVLSTRSYPPLRLGRLRVRGEMNEIQTEQLAFSEEEASSLLREGLGVDIGYGDFLMLLERTEGWPAAIYLAGLSLQGKNDPHSFIEAFHGSNRHIVDLLSEEVLLAFPEDVKQFLLQTSVLERMSGPLCDVVAQTEGSGKLLHDLAHTNLFVVPVAEDEEWYRYHHLFAEFLRHELRSTQPKLAPILHERASAWCEREGFVGSAIEHAIAAKEYRQAGALIARHWLGYLASGQTKTLERWLGALPENLINTDTAIVLVKAWISALQGREKESERYLALAEGGSHEGKLPDGSTSVDVDVALVRGLFGYGGVQAMGAAARRVEKLEPAEQTSPRTVLARLAVGMSLYYSGAISEARKPLEEALGLTAVGQPFLRIIALCFLSFAAADERRLEEAESLAREAYGVVKKYRLEGVPQCSGVPIALGRALADRGNLSEARLELERAVSARRRFPSLSPWPTLLGLLALARVLSAQGERGDAKALLAEVRAILEMYPDAGMFPELLKRQERKLRTRSARREEPLNEELTQRELDVLGLLLLDGELSNSQMGQSLYVAPSTVKTHLKSIYRKLGVSSRKEAVKQAQATGLI
jgi:LuxR family maltose regulon positive regulatory protein